VAGSRLSVFDEAASGMKNVVEGVSVDPHRPAASRFSHFSLLQTWWAERLLSQLSNLH
jgi:hypothetical protein